MKILVAAPVRQDETVFKHYLNSLDNLEGSFDRYFILHNSPNLKKFLKEDEYEEYTSKSSYDSFEHRWDNSNLTDLSKIKNKLLERANNEGYDYIFIVDSDTVLHPKTLKQLLGRKKDIVGEVLWTQWIGDKIESPNFWHLDFSDIKTLNLENKKYSREEVEFVKNKLKEINFKFNKNLTDDKLNSLSNYYCESILNSNLLKDTLNSIYREKSLFKVGGVGGCNLISKRVIETGVNFNPIYNISYSNWEDRAFCIRAAVAGFDIYVDTFYPATHLYTKDCLKKYESSITT